MKDIILSLFGTYTPQTYTDYFVDPITGTTTAVTKIAEGLASLDVPYVVGVVLFCLCLIAVFKALHLLFR